MERCSVSLSSLFCGFPLGPDTLFVVLGAAQHCFVRAVVLGFPCAEFVCVCVYNSSDTTTTPEHSSNLSGITSCSLTEWAVWDETNKQKKSQMWKEHPSVRVHLSVRERTHKRWDCYSGLQKLMSELYVKLMSVQRSYRGHRSGYRVHALVCACVRAHRC